MIIDKGKMLMKCGSCGAQFDGKLGTCPFCGGENKKYPLPKSLKVIFVVFGILFVVGLFNVKEEYQKQKQVQTERESSVTESKRITNLNRGPAQRLIKANGYTCDSIAAMHPFMLSDGYTVYCNDHRYEYEIKDVGGNWQVTVK